MPSKTMPSKMIVALFLLCFCFALRGQAARGEDRREEESLDIVSSESGIHTFLVERADTEAERRRGLMFRNRLAPNRGMLFWYNKPQKLRMWMKNTYIPLDMLFLDKRGRIVKIAAHRLPLSLEVVEAPFPVSAVLEVAAGTAARLALQRGDRVRHALFAP